MKISFLIVFIILVCSLKTLQAQEQKLRYIAVGDSYTIGTGVTEQQRWPTLLVNHLQKDGLAVEFVANLGLNGFTSQNALDLELPVLKKLKPTMATLLIGANDVFRGISPITFRINLQNLLDQMLEVIPQKKYFFVITIPDFSVTPAGQSFGNAEAVSKEIQLFNQIIQEEAKKRGLVTIDLFSLSQQMGKEPLLVANDGLHPSAQEHILWEQLISQEVQKILKK